MKRFSTMSMRPTPCLPLWGERVTWSQMLPTQPGCAHPRATCGAPGTISGSKTQGASEPGHLVQPPLVQVGKLACRAKKLPVNSISNSVATILCPGVLALTLLISSSVQLDGPQGK